MSISARYECPQHRVGLVLERVKLYPVRAGSKPQWITFYRCPAADGGIRCLFCKPNKWQKYPVKKR